MRSLVCAVLFTMALGCATAPPKPEVAKLSLKHYMCNRVDSTYCFDNNTSSDFRQNKKSDLWRI